ncbi:MAG: protoporphyrinogen oxidase [Clostridia bacterium]|nr:protoporphyrinogen oxidase [Clostridia bacterium]MBR0302535.1 protoporphyrinogen oxidase [Clostridia bacterium]
MQAGTPVYLKTADVCRMTGKSNQWIGQLTNQGILTKKQTPHGALYELTETMRAYIEMLDARAEERDDKEQKTEATRREAEAAFKKAKATVATLDAQERLGKMHRSEDVAAMTEDLIYTIRSGLLALPGRLAVDVMSAKDSAEASDIIEREIYKLMNELANYKYDAAKYQERVRERLNLEAADFADDDEEG